MGSKSKWFLSILLALVVMIIIQGQGCAAQKSAPTVKPTTTPSPIVSPIPTPKQTTIPAAPIPVKTPIPIVLALNPNRLNLSPGDKVVISVISEEWQKGQLDWKATISSGNLESAGEISSTTGSNTGTRVFYTAPKGKGEIKVQVTGRITGTTEASASVIFQIQPKP